MNTKLSNDNLGRPSAADFENTKKLPVIVVLENIRSMNNIGSVFRSSDAFLVQEIILCGYTAKPPHRDIQKTALGATETVKWSHYDDINTVIEKLKKEKFHVLAVEQTSKSIKLNEVDFNSFPSVALIFGNEVNGVEQSTIEQCNDSLEIDQHGTKHSLNVSVCAGIVLWKVAADLLKS
jgi:23S rRNA (guanosine2251-2'-O)-methyltransferase